MELNIHARLMERMDGNLYIKILEDLQESLNYLVKMQIMSSFSRTMILSMSAIRPESGFKTMVSRSFQGQHNLQTSILLNTCRII
jgi:hypothetical protein